jgi:hypothetical protein
MMRCHPRRTFVLLGALSLTACIEGPVGPEGPAGQQGVQGAQGLMGAPGERGEPGESVTAVVLDVGDSLCPNGGTLFLQDGEPVGTACNGQTGPQGIVAAVSAFGGSSVSVSATGPSSAAWISPTVQVCVSPGQKILVTATATLGSTAEGGARGLKLLVCYARGDKPSTTLNWPGGGAENLQVAKNTRQTFTLTYVLSGLSGTQQVGLCGFVQDAPPANWNSNDVGYVSAVVMN